MLDVSVPIAAIVREGAAGDAQARRAQAERRRHVAVAARRRRLARAGRQVVELAEQGFYSVRLQGAGERRPFQVAVNLDPAESDLSALPPAEFVAPRRAGRRSRPRRQSLENPELTPDDMEKKQSIWWFLFVAGAAAPAGGGRSGQSPVETVWVRADAGSKDVART